MGKILILVLDLMIVLAVLWFVLLRRVVSFGGFLAAISISILAVAALVGVAALFRAKAAARKTAEDELQAKKAAEVEQARLRELDARYQRKLAAQEARRPLCRHCEKKTSAVFRYRRKDGGPDLRYHDNPLLCDKCFRKFDPVAPPRESS